VPWEAVLCEPALPPPAPVKPELEPVSPPPQAAMGTALTMANTTRSRMFQEMRGIRTSAHIITGFFQELLG
jgi:hypothetical protein